MNMTVIQQVDCYTPEPVGVKDILIAGAEIIAIEDEITVGLEGVSYVDGTGKIAIPGLIDNHVHIMGGGGENGFASRTPELMLSEVIRAGVTTVVGVIGTDGTTRVMPSLIAKAKGLEEEGISAFVHTGNYQVPVRTCTGSITDDIILIDSIIGCGEVAISDHRASQPTAPELARIAAEARIGGMLSGKAGIVNVHIGDGKDGLQLIREVIEETDIPISQFLPTHINRNPALFEEGIRFAQSGGYVDFTTSTTPQFLDDGEVAAALAVKQMLDENVPLELMTMSSDAQGSLPAFNKKGELAGFNVAPIASLFESFKELVQTHNVPLEQAIQVVSTNPARILKLKKKGVLAPGMDADLLLLDGQDFLITDVFAKGRQMMANQEVTVKALFE